MNNSYLIVVFVAAVVVVTAAIFIGGNHFSRTETGSHRVQPGLPVEIDESREEHRLFDQAYAAKLENPDYQAAKSSSGGSKRFQDFSEEFEIKRLRSELAKELVAPAGTTLTTVPQLQRRRPAIDGFFSPNEWKDAIALSIGTGGNDTTIFLVADDERLYIACDAPGDTTEQGFDQFRFYVHLDITPSLVNERVHVGRRSGPLGGIRQTRVRWQGSPPAGENERWKTFDISDWHIYKHAQGASAIDGHRRFEAVLDIAEVGLHRGVPFPAWADVETDPERDDAGKFMGRRYLGQLGAQTAPVWFQID